MSSHTHSQSERNRQWKSLDELADDPVFFERARAEFPVAADIWPESLSRRRFLQLLSASLALAGLNGCMRPPEQKIVPYAKQPEQMIPERPLHFATTLHINGSPRGVVVTQNEGRPTHISGNALHPFSQGAADSWTMASLLDLYDPDRLQSVLHDTEPSDWDSFIEWVNGTLRRQLETTRGQGFALLTTPFASPTYNRLLQQILTTFPQAIWCEYRPVGSSGLISKSGDPIYDQFQMKNADIIFALESDFLLDRPDSLALVRDFSARRQLIDPNTCNRLYAAEVTTTVTGTKADHRFRINPTDTEPLAEALLSALNSAPPGSNAAAKWPWLNVLAMDLKAHAGRCVVIGGSTLPAQTQHILMQINEALGNINQTITYQSLSRRGLNIQPQSLAQLVTHLKQGEIKSLLILGGNPVYDAPSDFGLGPLIQNVPQSIHHSLSANETSAVCHWQINAAHDLESWGDAACTDGTLSITQPLIAPLYTGKSAIELLSALIQTPAADGYDLVRETWGKAPTPMTAAPPVSGATTPPVASTAAPVPMPNDTFENQWHRWLCDGVITPNQAVSVATLNSADVQIDKQPTEDQTPSNDNLWLIFRPSSAVYDGRYSNNGWLQELPDPVTKLTWDNAALVSPQTAQKLGFIDGDVVELQTGQASLKAPVLILPGQADGVFTVALGYGRKTVGSIGLDVGANAYTLRTSTQLWQMPLKSVVKTGDTHELAHTQSHFRMEGRDLLHVRALGATEVPAPSKEQPTLLENPLYPGHAWGMTIDLNACIGCNACIIACQSENNIPIVGKQQVLMSREMQWIRVDRYYEGSADEPRSHFQPVPCMQCEEAPCEVVCPVAATQHDNEGLNVMVYNRCVGTRYCSNNCPYKVRRFNFLFYNESISESQKLRLNPNVTVRSRGVMEKCTYCTQRIEESRISADREHRLFIGDDIITACQAACPAQAIVFGDLNDPKSKVAQNRLVAGHYALLAELNTKPRTTYLEKKLNLNPALASQDTAGAST